MILMKHRGRVGKEDDGDFVMDQVIDTYNDPRSNLVLSANNAK